MRCAITVCLVPEARQGPFVFHGDLEVSCARAAAAGFHAVELFPPSGEALDARMLQQALHRNRLDLAAVGTGAGWLTRRLTLSHPDAEIRRQAVEFVASMIDFAAACRAPVIIGSMQGRAEAEVTPDQALAWLAQSLEILGPRAQAAGIPLLLEPLNRYESNLLNSLAQTAEFLRSLRTQNLRILADLFHMNIEEASIPDALRAAGPLLGHVHFADSNRLAIGLGHTPVQSIADTLAEIGYSGYVSAEVFPKPSPEDAARQTIEAFRRLWAPS